MLANEINVKYITFCDIFTFLLFEQTTIFNARNVKKRHYQFKCGHNRSQRTNPAVLNCVSVANEEEADNENRD